MAASNASKTEQRFIMAMSYIAKEREKYAKDIHYGNCECCLILDTAHKMMQFALEETD